MANPEQPLGTEPRADDVRVQQANPLGIDTLVSCSVNPATIPVGGVVALRAFVFVEFQPDPNQPPITDVGRSEDYVFTWVIIPPAGVTVPPTSLDDVDEPVAYWDTTNLPPGTYTAQVTVGLSAIGIAKGLDPSRIQGSPCTKQITVQAAQVQPPAVPKVTLGRTATDPTEDLPLWLVIRKSSEAISFKNYKLFMDILLCGKDASSLTEEERIRVFGKQAHLRSKRFLPYNDVDAYRVLKVATEAFLMVNCGVTFRGFPFTAGDLSDLVRRVGVDPSAVDLNKLWADYLEEVNGERNATLPYLFLVRDKLKDSQIKDVIFVDDPDVQLPQECFGILREKLTNPCLLELIWSYWHEEGMLVQTLNTISLRFQNIRSMSGRDPLANLEIDPLRPLNNLIWGYIQDEQHRLSVTRRTYEYNHHYGMSLYGKAIPRFRPADSRSKFIEAFHNLLHLSSIFYKEDDDTTVIADGFPVLNALKDVHLLLSEGAHNQFGDLPSTARIEMLMQEWLLARPEFREFLPTRIMVAYPEPWMDRVDAMKKLQGWSDVSVLHFSNLGIFGERILLSIRFGAWNTVNDRVQAANWARFWREEIQGYVHAYRSVTGVDLTTDITDSREAELRYLPPSVHLRNRLQPQLKQLQKV
jgi:hypothetical protein